MPRIPKPRPATPPPVSTWTAPLDLTEGRAGAAPLFLWPDGRLSDSARAVPEGLALLPALISAARWVSARRTTSFERLFPPSAFHPERPQRGEALSAAQGRALLQQLRAALASAAVGATASQDPSRAARLRSAAMTVLSHLLATSLRDPSFRAVCEGPAGAAATLFALVDAEQGADAEPALRAHGIQLLQLRGPALSPADRERAAQLLRGQVRAAPPYDELTGPWRFAMCSAWDFHEGEVEILKARYGFVSIPTPEGTPAAADYTVVQAPFVGPLGQPIQIFARSASPQNENREMAEAFFTGLLINRHAQLGAFDMQAVSTTVHQVGYKLMMNSQCAGLTTRFAISKAFPQADIYSSWDSTYFNTANGKVSASEGLDCFVALLEGLRRSEAHDQLAARMQLVQWHHPQASVPGFCQFIGPSHPLVVARYSDVNSDGRADYYDGYLDLDLQAIAEDLQASATPRDPGLSASQIGGDAARGLGWAAGSLNRVTQYSDLWAGLPAEAESLYLFQAAGFYSQREPPEDVPGLPYLPPGGRGGPTSRPQGEGLSMPRGPAGALPPPGEALARLPALCRFYSDPSAPAGFTVDVLLHSHLSHAAQELKRLLCAAEALWRCFQLGYLPARGPLQTPLGQRGMLLLTLVGLLEFPADQNFVEALWGMALKLLNLPPLSRSVVRRCITSADHDASNYYGSLRGLRQLCGAAVDGGAAGKDGELWRADPLAYDKLRSDDPSVGRALPLPV